jgi:hypothetical protein
MDVVHRLRYPGTRELESESESSPRLSLPIVRYGTVRTVLTIMNSPTVAR